MNSTVYPFPILQFALGKIGFEPMVFLKYSYFQDRRLKPLSHFPKKKVGACKTKALIINLVEYYL